MQNFPKNILLVGATSSIASRTALILARQGSNFYLVGRNERKLAKIRDELKRNGAEDVRLQALDFNDFTGHQPMLDKAWAVLRNIDLLFIAHGSLCDQKACEKDIRKAREEFDTNFASGMSIILLAAERFEKQKSGCIAVISSVAGDRGRGSNFIYGAAKGALSIFLQGLRNRLFPSGVQVLTIKPGFVSTPLTSHLPKNFLFAEPEVVAQGIVNAIRKGKNIVYLPPCWRWIMLVIRCIPESVFKRFSS